MYIHQDYPKVKYHWNKKPITIKNSAEEAALGGGWASSPGAFKPYQGPRPTRTVEQNPVKWLDEWSVPGLSSAHRKKIKAHLLRADGTFERSLDADSAALASMRQAFDGIASVLFDAGILTEDLLQTDVPQLVWDSAIAGGWWRLASETCQDIFPERLGHYWVWRDDSGDWKSLFRAEAGEWEAKLLEIPSRELPAVSASVTARLAEPQARSQRAESPPERKVVARPTLQANKWEDIEIAFISDERVQISVGTQIETRNYAEMGFASKTSGNPVLAWATLRAMAEAGGVTKFASDSRKWAEIEKRIQEIRRVLRQMFGLTDDPLPYIKKTRPDSGDFGYRARFKIFCRRSYES